MNLTEPNVVALPDITAELPCEVCDDPARWALICRPCGHQPAVCVDCHDSAAGLILPASDEMLVYCERCGELVFEIDWRLL